MANQQSAEGSSPNDVPGESSESTLQLNIKTLDSRMCSFHVDKNIVVSAFKEKIASQIGVPVEQQRLIFRGKVLKDNHLLSAYNVENEDTLHLVERQPQPSPSNAGEATSSTNNRGQDPTVGGQRNRIGQIAHSVVLGTLNVGEPGDAGGVPDLSRVIGAVLNSIGIGSLAGVQPGVQTSVGSETGGSSVNAGSQSQGGNPSVPLQQALHGQSIPFPMPIPMGAAIAVPSMNMPIPDSLNTLTEFMRRMELAFAQNGIQQEQPPTASANPPTPELPRNTRGFPTAEALTVVLRHAQSLLRDHAVPALSHTAGRLDQDGGSNDPAVRGQVQAESTHLGVAMQHLGALLLELGRTILTFRMGQSPGDSFVNAGPAVYISPSGPNPIMVQPFPLQTSSLFGSSPGVTPNPVAMNPVGVGNISRNVNIHIHTGAALAPIVSRARSGEERQSEPVNGTDSGQPRVSSGINVNATAVPPRPGAGVSQASDSNSIHPLVAEISAEEVDAQLRSLYYASRQNESRAPSEGAAVQEQPVGTSSRVGGANQTLPDVAIKDNQQVQTGDSTSSEGGSRNRSSLTEHAETLEGQSIPRQGNDNPDRSSGTPLGLGLGGLQPKRRARQPKPEAKNNDAASSSDQNEKSRAVGQHVLQSLASLSTRGNGNPPLGQPSDPARGRPLGSVLPARQNTDGHIDVTDAMSQVLQSPSLDGLLAGVSQQTGVGSPDMLRNMLQQFTQNPAMRNTVNQIAQQIDSHDLGSMFSGLDNRGQGGGIDLSRMMQQMMPIVSQALGGVSSIPRASEPVLTPQSTSRRDTAPRYDDPQIDLSPLVQRLEVESSSEEVFRSLVDRAVHLSSNGNAEESGVNELCSQEDLIQEFMEMLRIDVTRRLHDEMGS